MAKNKELTLEEKLKEALIPKEEQPYEIPESWEWVRLENVTSKITDGTHKTPTYIDDGVPFISVKNIKNNKIYFDDIKYISQEEHKELYKRCNPEKGDILITKSGTIGRTAEVKEEFEFSLFVSVALIKNYKNIILSKYLLYNTNDYMNKINIASDIKGGVIKNYHISDIKKQPIPLPPLEEQKRIVEKLDSMFEKINKAKELIQEVKENIENRKESILNKAFRGELTAEWRKNNQTEDAIELLKSINEEKLKNWEEACIEAEKNGKKKPSKPKIEDIQNIIISKEEEPYEIPKNWKWVKLGEVIDIKMGQSPNGETVNNTEGIGLIGGPNDMGNLYPKISRYTTSFTKLSSKDDIILSVRATLGRPIFSDGEYCLGRGVCGISSEIINKIFLRHYFFNITDYLYTIATGTTFVQISKENIINLNFPLPPLKEQEEIVRILDEILEKESKIKELIELEEAIELLEKSILDKAFRGELGTQNKEDEPAIELLKKIL
ncbi:restriction endonuclease subunit S [uncultured Fusobacterium sp.]|uniref:restriction endonuclease subunit S n=1 Tax=uncultured Fusobacterium sp. TaxID=159267 RepID=UPI0027DE616E|nr:restriction endonuclease subunit S [uncultured Fusobacterium sp.]